MRLLGRVWECSESAVTGKLVGSYSEARGGALEVQCSLFVLTHLSALYFESMPQVIQTHKALLGSRHPSSRLFLAQHQNT